MSEPVMAILQHQGALSARARQSLGDVNEAGVVVTRVISRAFRHLDQAGPNDEVSAHLMRDLDQMIASRRRPS